MKKILITGATGMVGSHLLEICLQDHGVDEAISLVRRTSEVEHPKLTEVLISDFGQYDPGESYWQSIDAAFFCIGVYTGAVSREKFREITVDYPLAFAKALYSQSPDARFLLLSGAGADRTEKSRMMFAKDKGAVENQLSVMGFKAFHAFRPGYIYPVVPRKEPNFSYTVSRALYPLIKLFGKKYSIPSTDLAQAMFQVGRKGSELEILENADILAQLD